MNSATISCLCAICSYLLGAIPIGFCLARCKGIDLRKVGSGNIGATNVGRAMGKPWAVAAFVGDALKGYHVDLHKASGYADNDPTTRFKIDLTKALGKTNPGTKAAWDSLTIQEITAGEQTIEDWKASGRP